MTRRPIGQPDFVVRQVSISTHILATSRDRNVTSEKLVWQIVPPRVNRNSKRSPRASKCVIGKRQGDSQWIRVMECSDLSELWIVFGRGASRIARDTGRLAPYHYCGGGCAWDRTARAVPLLWGWLRVGPDGSRRTTIVGTVARGTGRLAPCRYCGDGCAWDRTARAVPLLWGRLRVGPDGSRRAAIVGVVARGTGRLAPYHYCGGGCAWDRTARAVPLLWGGCWQPERSANS
jgi:hypothetical protein